ncbi:hypothetical protein F5880DRAFT_285300 [Lentinula raphanica]|nr:hypothetical protein F5880DRAFT_285300 [Lentinula raphanica]
MKKSDGPGSLVPFTISRGGHTFLIREADPDAKELDDIAWGAAEAFLDDKVMNYFSGNSEIPTSVTSTAGFKLYQFYRLIFKACMFSRGRVIVAEYQPTESDHQDKPINNNIAAAAAWYGPRQEIQTIATIRAGALTCVRNYGRLLLKRIGEFKSTTRASYKRAFQVRDLTPSSAWYLQSIFTAKRFEGQGLMSALVREGFDHALKCSHSEIAPPVILESSSDRSRPRYLHLGFEIIEPWCNIGKGKVDSTGCRPNGNSVKSELEGIQFTCMVNVSVNCHSHIIFNS